MAVRRLDKNDDWTFGRSLADYTIRDKEILQNIKTRLRSFKFDWLLDIQMGIDWLDLLGRTDTKDDILSEIRRVVLSTNGVVAIRQIDIITNTRREAEVIIKIDTIFSQNLAIRETVNAI